MRAIGLFVAVNAKIQQIESAHTFNLIPSPRLGKQVFSYQSRGWAGGSFLPDGKTLERLLVSPRDERTRPLGARHEPLIAIPGREPSTIAHIVRHHYRGGSLNRGQQDHDRDGNPADPWVAPNDPASGQPDRLPFTKLW